MPDIKYFSNIQSKNTGDVYVVKDKDARDMIDTKADNAPTFTEASTRANIASGETMPTILGKIKKFFTDLKTVAFSGSYTDLSDKPTIPAAANNGTLTIQKNGTNVQTFTANQSTNATANITVPTKTSELTNDSGYTTNTGTVTSVKVGSTSYNPSSGVVSLPAYPTSLPASNTTSTYSASGTAPVNGTAVAAALGTLDVSSVGGSGKYISTISETDGKISATAANMPTSLPASDVSAWAKASTKPSYNFGEIGAGVATIGNGNANYGIKWRTQDTWLSGVYYNTSGDESVIFANENKRTSWMFAYTDMDTYPAWTTLTPSMQIKNGKVTINKLIPNDQQASYNLDVNGTANATTIYENGTALSSKYALTSAIPTVNNGTLTIQKNGTNVQTFTANQSTNATANITVPTKVSELTNDSGYTTNTGTVTSVKVGSTSYNPSSGVVSLPAYPTTLPASNTTSTYSATGTAPVNGTAVAAALGTLDVASVGGTGKYISTISETNGKITATATDLVAVVNPSTTPTAEGSIWIVTT